MSFARTTLFFASIFAAFPFVASAADNTPPEGFVALFNGKDLDNWRGLPLKPQAKDPTKTTGLTMPERLAASPEELATAQKIGDESAKQHWKAVDGVILFDGKGQNLCTDKDYGNFELYVDWKIEKDGDSGIYLRGSPQIQIWDPDLQIKKSNERIGSGGIYNNAKNPSKPTKVADKTIGQWNTFWIKMVGDSVCVKLNGELVVDDVVMENYWDKDRKTPIYPKGTIELQNHGNVLFFKNIYVKELP
ncbi:MAG: DUF1080 domain-containing protein [Planctomycetia bacterium]|nr:DUF1080 domain-containing protein [Planctomycetia bacterium]